MKDSQESLHEPISSFIGEKASFTGEFVLEGSIRIDGVFSGKILSESKVIVGKTGHVKTNIQAKIVVVAGKVDGNIYALESVHLLESAKVYGDIISANLTMDDGVVFEGRARINKQITSPEFFSSGA
ncbi:MAG: polymer-forming cytoskeletal protein [Spirochaetia bacterium]|nr:polymer-forming cytoskeletal protein [Spirochaetia bacterium]